MFILIHVYPDKRHSICFLLISLSEKNVVATHWKRLIETFPMSCHNKIYVFVEK